MLQQRDGAHQWPVQWRRQGSVFLFCCHAGWTTLVWLELGVYDFCRVGCMFVSGQQQGAWWRLAKAWPGGWRLVSWTGSMVCVVWKEQLKPRDAARDLGEMTCGRSVRWLSVFMGCLTRRSVMAIERALRKEHQHHYHLGALLISICFPIHIKHKLISDS